MVFLNKLVVFFLPFVPKFIVYMFAKRYIAGPTLDDAVDAIKRFNSRGMLATVDILGEEIEKEQDALQVVEQYKQVLLAIDENKLDSNISIKPTHLGLKIDKEFCYNNIREIVQEAARYNNFVRVDMEDHTCTSDTIELYLRVKRDFDNVGVVIQSYLRRTLDDVNQLVKQTANLRLCKGIYVESRKIAYKDREIINENFCYCLSKLLENNCYVGIATHDEKLVWHALAEIDRLGLNRDQYEFQMLLGVTEELRDILLAAGHRLRIYVPFGQHWHAYSTRRLKENPTVATYILRNIFKRN